MASRYLGSEFCRLAKVSAYKVELFQDGLDYL